MLAVTIPIQAAGSPALVNQQSLQSANDFLRVASATIATGEFLDRAPSDIGKDAGIPNPLAVDRRYRLLDGTPLAPGEPESVPRSPRRRKPRKRAAGPAGRAEAGATGDRR